METKGITCKIPLQLHDRISGEIRETDSTMSKFIEMMLRAPSPVFPAGNCDQDQQAIPKRKGKQKMDGSFRPLNGKGGVQSLSEPAQQIYEVCPAMPASGCQQGRPPDNGQGEEPHPPWFVLYDSSFLSIQKRPPRKILEQAFL